LCSFAFKVACCSLAKQAYFHDVVESGCTYGKLNEPSLPMAAYVLLVSIGAAILQSLTMVAGFGIRTFQYCLLNAPTQLT